MATKHNDFDRFRDALDKTTGDGRDLDSARELSDAYIAAHPEQFGDFAGMDAAAVAQAVDTFRSAGMDDAVTRAEMWVRSAFEPQQIGGQVDATRRTVPGFK